MILKKHIAACIITFVVFTQVHIAQHIIPLDTTNWDIRAKSYMFENYKGKDAIYIQNGAIILKDSKFLNGTIEFDIFLKEDRMYPGVFFRAVNNFQDGELWFMRAHLSGLEDATQAAPAIKGITAFQFYFGEKYSFAHEFKYDDWTHVKIVVNNDKAQVFLDHSETPNLSWKLFHKPKEGDVMIRGGRTAMHIANVIVDKTNHEIKNFNPKERKPIENLIPKWEISDMFEEQLLDDPNNYKSLINNRNWQGYIHVEEGTAANISRIQLLRNGQPGNTVFAKIEINSDKDQLKFFSFGYSDRVVTILNGKPIYRGTNKWRSRDYRYLGTIGLFDGIYLDLKKGKNTLLMAVSEDFGGWLITGKFEDKSGLKIN
ncbi:hypothetical protein [uncultured Psychroserpens sp.]|uniref:hypothetical protein n=1 Tax=uncultured Psychroserpens sp. TaxID=255436 RepID=UPI002606FC78|nr:hypothetical protein [uncultured Psychroserpens sp.]